MQQRTKKDFIAELIKDTQDTIWKNELAVSYNEQFPNENKGKSQEQIDAAKHAMEKDIIMLAFLREEIKSFD